MTLLPNERSRDVFEAIAGYEKPPLAPLPGLSDYEDLARHGLVKLTPASRRVVSATLRAIGYHAFHAGLGDEIEGLLRSTNMREKKLFAPVYSATVALADDGRALGPLDRAATLVVAAHALSSDVMSGTLPPDVHRGQPLEMGQYPNLFATTVARVGRRTRLFKAHPSGKIAVIVRRRIYILELGADGTPSVTAVRDALAAIVADADRLPALKDDEAPGVLSAAGPKTLETALKVLERSPESARSVAALRAITFVLCLDLDDRPASDAGAFFAAQATNVANRWYLSSFQLVVFGNAKACGIFSFPAYLDGNVMMRGAAELQRRGARAAIATDASSTSLPAATPLGWAIDPRLVQRAWRDVRSIRDPQRSTFTIDGIGRRRFEELGVDPVGAFVVALAIAARRLLGEVPKVHQLVTVSKFRCLPVGGAVVTTPAVASLAERVAAGDRAGAAALLSAAVAEQEQTCRQERSRLSLRWAIEAFVRTRRGAERLRCVTALGVAAASLAAMGCLGKLEIVISHPQIVPELPLVGRPGVRLPYVRHFALHYQMFVDSVVVTFMPGTKWRYPNAELARAIEGALADVAALAELSRGTPASAGAALRPTLA